MRKEYDYERSQRIKTIAIDWAYNIMLVILFVLILLGLLFCIIDFNIPAIIGVLLGLVLLIGGAWVYMCRKEIDRARTADSIKFQLSQPKFKYLTEEEKTEIILDIYHLL